MLRINIYMPGAWVEEDGRRYLATAARMLGMREQPVSIVLPSSQNLVQEKRGALYDRVWGATTF